MKRQDLNWLLDTANEMRRLKNDDLLNDLPMSYMKKSSRCLIANAFNYGCRVYPGPRSSERSIIVFKTEEDLDTYLKVMEISEAYVLSREKEDYSARLTQELNEVALGFDNYNYPQYIAG